MDETPEEQDNTAQQTIEQIQTLNVNTNNADNSTFGNINANENPLCVNLTLESYIQMQIQCKSCKHFYMGSTFIKCRHV